MSWSAGAGILLVLFVGIFAERATAQGRDLLVFAPASLKNALDDVNAEYQRQTGRKVVVSYAASPARAQRDVTIAPGFPLTNLLGGGRLAMADPDSVPAGKYGKAALEHLGVWAAVSGTVARTDNVRACLLLVARKEA